MDRGKYTLHIGAEADSEGGGGFGVGVQQNPLYTKISFSWGSLDKFGTLFLIFLFNKSILLPVNVFKLLSEWHTV